MLNACDSPHHQQMAQPVSLGRAPRDYSGTAPHRRDQNAVSGEFGAPSVRFALIRDILLPQTLLRAPKNAAAGFLADYRPITTLGSG
jgi:hypothetical protein